MNDEVKTGSQKSEVRSQKETPGLSFYSGF